MNAFNAFRPLARLVLLAAPLLCSAQTPTAHPTRAADEDLNAPEVRARAGMLPGANLLHNGWGVTPAGKHTHVSDMPLKMIISPDKRMLVAVSGGFRDTGLTLLDLKTQEVAQFLPLKECWNGVAFNRAGKRIFVSGGDTGLIHVFDYANFKATPARAVSPRTTEGGTVFLAGIAVHPTTGRVYVCNEGNHEIWVLHPDTLALEAVVPVGLHPHSCLFGADQKHLYVSNWGSRTVSVIDTETRRRTRDITVGLRPNDLALAPDGRLFVACAGDNTVHVIGTAQLEKLGEPASPARRLWEGTREIISTSLYPQALEGSTPSAVTVAPDGRTLFVVNSDNNNVMVVDISNRLTEEARERGDMVSIVGGFIPVGWYPTAVAVSPDNQTLFVANGKGLASRANYPARLPDARVVQKVPFDYIGRTFDGAISAIPRPDARQMAAYTEQVRKNSPYTPAALTRAPMPSQSVIPEKVGDPCPIKYVLYIIKENRTYDQVLGDLKDASGRPLGNGDPDIAIFGEKVTPNQHQLARDYVLFDNLYSNSEVSVDGHSWCDAAIATDFNQRSWIVSYSKHGKLPGNEEMENPANGYLWDLCRRHGITYKNYGEGAQRVPSQNRGKWGGRANYRDMNLVDFWITDLKKAEAAGAELPRFTIMSLGENHTSGTTPDAFTPNACVASNDIGLGKIVAAASRSKFWKEMAIFVIEDDTQNGPDHVDAHRTTGFVFSPYVKRGFVDSTLYTTASLIRTMELILGLPPLTQYDAAATPMFNAFQREAVVTPYDVLTPQVDLNERNTKRSAFWRESSRMNFADYDRAPEDELNRILWHVAKGDVPYPAPIHRAVFTR